MKYFYILFAGLLTFTTSAQTYNVVLNPTLDMVGTLPPGETFGASANFQNKSTAAIASLSFYWYLSSDSAYDAGDIQISSFTSSSDPSLNNLLQPNASSYVGTSLAVIPSGYTAGCNYFVIMRAVIGETETTYTDNFAYSRLCIRDKRIDLQATSISSDKNPYYKGINSTNAVVSAVITNDGELPASSTISYDLKLGTSSDPAVGNVYSVRKTLASLASKTSTTVNQTFDISTLAAGTYYLFLQIDADNLINDPIRNNNSIVQTFRIANLDSLNGQDILMPTGTTNRYVATCGATVYDNGGTADYLPNTNSTLYLYPGEANKKIRVKITEYNFNGADYMRVYYYASPYIGYQYLTVTNTSTFPIEFIPPAADGSVYITEYSDATTQASGAKIEISCAPAFEYQTLVSAASKATYIGPVDEIVFTAGIKNRGYNTITSLNYTYGVSTTASQSNVLYESATNTTAQINVNSSVTIPATNKILLKDAPITTAGTYYVFVKALNADDNTLDNISYYPVNIVLTDTVKNVSVNFQNNKNLYYTSCDMTLYDDGGAAGNYSNNFSGRVTIFPDSPDKIVKLILTYNLETKLSGSTSVLKDILSIYDGLTNVKKLTLPVSYGAPVYYTDGSAMIDFTSDAATNLSGFKITVGCANKGIDYKNESTDIQIDTALYGIDKLIGSSMKAITNGSVNGIPQYGVLSFKVYVSPTPSKANAIFTSPVNYYAVDNVTNTFYSSYYLDLSTLPAITSSGKYYFITEVDPANSIVEVDETNNILADSFYIKVLPPGELRIPVTGTYTVTACNSKLYGYSGATKTTTSIDAYTPPVIKINPADVNSKLKFVVNTYTASSNDVQILVYDRAVNATNPVLTITRLTVFPASYTVATAGNPLEIKITVLNATGNSYKLDANVVCAGAFDFALSNTAIDENVPASSVVGTLSSVNAVSTDVFTYDFIAGTGDSDNGSFVISGNELQIKNSPDFETQNSYTIRVRSKNQNGAVIEKAFIVTINDLNEVPLDFALSNAAIDENVPASSVVGTLSPVNAVPTDVFTYDFITGAGDSDNGSFVISGNELRIKNSPDFETQNSYTIRVQCKNQSAIVVEKSFIVTITDLNEAPTDFALSAYTIPENVPVNTTIGTFTSTDPDAGNTFTYEIVAGAGDADNASFSISGNALVLLVSPDYETKNSYSVLVRSSDQGGLRFEKSIIVSVIDQNEKPGIADQSYSVNENVALGSYVGTVVATTDSGEELTYAIVSGNESAAFAIDAVTGDITADAALNYNTISSYTLVVQVTDNSTSLLDSSAVVTIHVNQIVATGIHKALSNSAINIYPNPSTDNATIDVQDASVSIQTITIINALGEVVSVKPYSTYLDLSGLSSGLYTLLLNGENVSYTKQLIVR
jgi:hypothetical protein